MPAAAVDTVRFGFGANWRQFLNVVTEGRIRDAERSLRDMLNVEDLTGRSLLDVGCGSGLFSLAAARLGARVRSFDYDCDSVACAVELRARFAPAADWTIEQGSVLDSPFLDQLGRFDIVYSWGVLHHTGDLWHALAAVVPLVNPGGRLFISIYNDQGWRSKFWTWEKRMYTAHAWTRPAFVLAGLSGFAVGDILRGRWPWRRYRQHQARGMSAYRDLIDWLGGYPFEVASPEAIERFYVSRGFGVERRVHIGSRSGCNEFVFAALHSGDSAGRPSS